MRTTGITRIRTTLAARLLAALLLAAAAGPLAAAEQATATATPSLRAARDSWSAVMDLLRAQRTRVTDEQLARLKKVPIEAVWAAIQGKEYRHCFVNDLKLTQPGTKLVGRALTMRYLPVRPDLMEAVKTLAKEGDWDFQYNVRAGEDTRPGDVLVVELGGMVDRATFMGDVTGLGIKSRGAAGVVIDGGLRDLNEFLPWKDFPVYYGGAHASAMADQVGVEWNVPVRIKNVTVLPGDVVIGDESGLLFFPPQFADDAIKAAEETVYIEDFKRELMRGTKYRARDIYPKASPEVEKLLEEWKKAHPRT
jgi:4-hydroxy-4-methyl-2-oxoglutarate aldolase